MEDERETIYDMVEALNLKIESIYGEKSNLDFSEINPHSNMNKCSMLVLWNDSISFNREKEKRNEIIEIDVKKIINRQE